MKTVVITGGSRGIGAAAVALFAEKGHKVFFLYEKEHEAAKQVAAATGATAICCDVADGQAVRNAFAGIPDVDILICNAGIMHFGLLSMMEEAAWDRIFDVNVKGIYHCVNAAMPFFLRKQKGCIITVSSMWGQVGASCESAYAATKGAALFHQAAGHDHSAGVGNVDIAAVAGGLTAGDPINVKEGTVYPIEIAVTEEGGAFGYVLMWENLTDAPVVKNGKVQGGKKFYLFRTNFSEPKPEELQKLIGKHKRSDHLEWPEYEADCPIWVAVP